jgi:hypothetical protein
MAALAIKELPMDIDAIANEYIEIAQENFGPICSEWNYIGVEIKDMAPHLGYYPDEGNVVIFLSNKVRDDKVQLHFQLAHEVCHLLYPTMTLSGDFEKPTVMNEGVSTYFSVWAAGRYTSQEFLINNLQEHGLNYYLAMEKVHELMTDNQNHIKRLRQLEPKLNKLQKSHFKNTSIAISDTLVDELLSTFK